MTVNVHDILDHLVARSQAPSTFGAQLDRIKYGIVTPPDPFRARDEAENHLMQQAALLRCIDDFCKRQVLPVEAKQIEKLQRECKLDQGFIALVVLRSFHEWRGQGETRALVSVYRALSKIAPKTVPTPPTDDTVDLVQVFREGRAKRCSHMAAEAYADALLGLRKHVAIWNDRTHEGNQGDRTGPDSGTVKADRKRVVP